MRAASIVRKLLEPCLEFIHSARFTTLLLVVEAVFRSSRLTLTALGRALPSTAHAKHRIKRIDRLLGNAKLHAERPLIARQVVQRVIGNQHQPIIVVDWTQILDRFCALWAGVAFLGRTIPLYVEVHEIRKRTKRKIHINFLRALRDALPKGCEPILVFDAEFTVPFFDACSSVGFKVVARLRGRCALRRIDGSAVLARELAKEAGGKPQCRGLLRAYDAARRGRTMRIVLARKPRARRRPADPHNQYRRRALEAWVLATTIEDAAATSIVQHYAHRMQVEEMFRDAKNPRYGWALSHTGSRDRQRLSILLLIATLAMFAAVLVGAAAENSERAYRLQANTERRRRVLSLFRIGVLLLTTGEARFGTRALLAMLHRWNGPASSSSQVAPSRSGRRRYVCTECRRGYGWHG